MQSVSFSVTALSYWSIKKFFFFFFWTSNARFCNLVKITKQCRSKFRSIVTSRKIAVASGRYIICRFEYRQSSFETSTDLISPHLPQCNTISARMSAHPSLCRMLVWGFSSRHSLLILLSNIEVIENLLSI